MRVVLVAPALVAAIGALVAGIVLVEPRDESPMALAAPVVDEAPAGIDAGDAPVPTAPDSTGSVAEAPVVAGNDADPDLWIGKPVLSADGVEVGEVSDVQLDADGLPMSITTTVGGFLGVGGTPVRLPVDTAGFDGKEVRLAIVETDVAAFAATEPARWSLAAP